MDKQSTNNSLKPTGTTPKDPKYTYKPSKTAKSPKSDKSSLDSISSIKEGLKENLKSTTLAAFHHAFRPDSSALSEAIMSEGGSGNDHAFGITLPVAVEVSPPDIDEPLPPEQVVLPSTEWYPHQWKETVFGENTRLYLSLLKRVAESEMEAFNVLKSAEEVGRSIDCPKTSALWKRLNTLLPALDYLDIAEVACDLAYYMTENPKSLDPYLKCLSRVRLFLANPVTAMKTLEEKATALTSQLISIIDESAAHRDETSKFASQVSNVSANLAGLQEAIEQTVVKVSKLDLLPSTNTPPLSEISIPSSIQRKEGIKIVEVSG